ncbi:MAG: phage integrase N-terminal SAM-like domain-containing protein [Desulfuromusa sp.]|nr:phage integrase N-terminal SAM-like domain-containing protein [Desulfuromusa sp.]
MENVPRFNPDPDFKLMDQVRKTLRYVHYAYRTEQSYCQWILRHIRFCCGAKPPKKQGCSRMAPVYEP